MSLDTIHTSTHTGHNCNDIRATFESSFDKIYALNIFFNSPHVKFPLPYTSSGSDDISVSQLLPFSFTHHTSSSCSESRAYSLSSVSLSPSLSSCLPLCPSLNPALLFSQVLFFKGVGVGKRTPLAMNAMTGYILIRFCGVCNTLRQTSCLNLTTVTFCLVHCLGKCLFKQLSYV